MVDVEKALADPSSQFQTPGDVLQSEDVSRHQRIAILRQWELDARRLQVADDESMTGEEPAQLKTVLDALHALGAR